MLFFRKNKRQFGYRRHRKLFAGLFCFALILTLTVMTFVKTMAADVPVPSVEIFSRNTSYANNNPGSWKITKSAKWTDEGKARITFEVDSVLKYDAENKLDVVMVIDNSESMWGDKIDQVIHDAAELTESVLSDQANKIALITFNSSATVVSGLTNDKDTLLNQIRHIGVIDNTNYYQGLLKAEEVLEGYQKQENRDLIMLFLTDGYPNEDTPNEIGQYQTLKAAYPYMVINGIQYEMGDKILQPIINVSDIQYIASISSLNNVLFETVKVPFAYDNFTITDYINDDVWNISSIDAIEASLGTVALDYEGLTPKITWDMSGFYRSGQKETLTIDINLNNELINDLENEMLLPTNKHEVIVSNMEGTPSENIDSTETPKLRNIYKVSYDANAPSDCEPQGTVPDTENHSVYSVVEISDATLTCAGYNFGGWESVDVYGANKINDDYFRMPEKNITFRAIWAKPSISKSLNGTIHAHTDATLAEGWVVNSKIKALSGQEDADEQTVNETITSVTRSYILSDLVDTNDEAYDISDIGYSDVPIYAWFKDGVIYYYSEADDIYLNNYSEYLFSELRELQDLRDIMAFKTDYASYMDSAMYRAGYNLETFNMDLSGWDLSKVYSANGIFNEAGYMANTFNLNLSNSKTQTMLDLENAFYGTGYNAETYTLDLTGWNTSNVRNLEQTFAYAGLSANSWQINGISAWNTSSVTNMASTFYYAGGEADVINIDLSEWKTSAVTDMSETFCGFGYNSESFSMDLSDWDVSNVVDMASTFNGTGEYATTWSIGDLSEWKVSKVKDFLAMFANTGQNAASWTIGDLSGWNTSSATNMQSMFEAAGSGATNWSVGDISHWDTSKVKDMGFMFSGAGYDSEKFVIDLSGWDTSSVTTMYYMFSGAGHSATDWAITGLQNWDVSNVTSMADMFSDAGYSATNFSLNLSGWNAEKVKYMGYMFYSTGHDSQTYNLNITNWNTPNVTTIKYMFRAAGYNTPNLNIDLTALDTQSVTDMTYAFFEAGWESQNFSLNVSGWDTSSVTTMAQMFARTGYDSETWAIIGLSGWDVSAVNSFGSMFSSAATKASSFVLDLSSWTTSSATGMGGMFNSAGESATTWSVGDISHWDTSKVESMGSMFYNAGKNATNFALDLSGWNTSGIKSTKYMFDSVGSNSQTFSLNVSGWDTSNVTDMSYTFHNAGAQATDWTLTGLSTWNTSSVTTMTWMFGSAGNNATNYVLVIPRTNGNGIENTTNKMYGATTSVYANPPNSRLFTLAE